jgi:hypothetical protein
LLRCRESAGTQGSGEQGENLYRRLMAQCRQRASCFAPARERAELHRLVEELLADDLRGAD